MKKKKKIRQEMKKKEKRRTNENIKSFDLFHFIQEEKTYLFGF